MTTTTLKTPRTAALTPTARVLTASLVVGPLIYLAADSMYAARGWQDATAGVLHVLGAIGYGFVVLAVATWLRRDSRLTAVLVVTGLIGMAGNVAYGFETIHQSFGDVQLVDRDGAANLIKPLGLFFPLSLFAVSIALHRLGCRWQSVTVCAAAVAWPIAHIGNIAEVAVPVNIALTLAIGSLALGATDLQRALGSAERAPAS
jgi:hypothetical protein